MRLLALLLLPIGVQAAPFLTPDPYPATGTQPDSASMTINGGSPVACSLATVTGGIQPKCDLASITSPGSYTLVLTVVKNASIVNGTNTATNTAGSQASSAPFVYVLNATAIASPANSKVGP
jgi:hypothetical protein